jgi:hypothetical protein
MNIAMFWAAHKHTPPIMDRVAQYIAPTFLPYLSMTHLPIRTPKNAPAWNTPLVAPMRELAFPLSPGFSIDQRE